jgi:hypothetical protein
MNTMSKAATLTAAAALAVLAVTGCASQGPSATASAAAAVRSAQAPSCTDLAVTWRDNGGRTQLGAVVTDLTAIRNAATNLESAANTGGDVSGPEAALQSAAASLGSDTQAAEADPPPACVPGLRSNYEAALTDYSKTASDYQNAVSALASGSYGVAGGDVTAGTTAASAGDTRFLAAAAAMKAFNNS